MTPKIRRFLEIAAVMFIGSDAPLNLCPNHKPLGEIIQVQTEGWKSRGRWNQFKLASGL
ncbi:MAG: hypothetical protein JSW39_16860 [Desulfobacterales bacterium]|nr:MAG: hypothetical protein JSW39_16860 [Desulfobacterales bacterium]